MSKLPGDREKLSGVSTTDLAPDLPTAQLYTGIVLYSTADPEADAMLIADGMIAWIGTADSAAVLHPDTPRIDATGCLVTPGFVDAAATADGSLPAPHQEQAAAARGIVLRLPGPAGTRDGVRVIVPGDEPVAYRDYVRDGIPFTFGSGGAPQAQDPWSWVRAAAHDPDPDQRVGDRAAFLAATRGGQRAAGHRHPGDLRTGLPATFVVWEPWDLTVRSEAEGVDTWSTDPRSRTPLLPDLDQGSPRALRTVIDGRIVHDSLPKAEA
ncbi:hypothetical protein [Brachybacterium sp. UMB0905]|uniref:hypothetical protein n=1 Tax=Brachybacterium sp. UMB0905 TaxID=2069310 RepID=UPI000C80FBCB|nr:hypothetical protein [Brachybacterium sp. UMB0905]PMC75316.1 hypothetical protein CJ197_08205 [Brachybacterium sp. UMB0905]